MLPPKNGSLGRGLGDLLGGVPETIGVAGVPPPPRPEIQALPQGGAKRPAEPQRRLILEFTVGLILFLAGLLLGFWAAQK